MPSTRFFLLGIFLLALLLRFLYFPDNVNFAYDQARDSFAALEILKGDLKIVGPPTTASDQIFHGVLFYYLLAPIYFFSGHSPEIAAALFRVVNTLGVFLVFLIGTYLFNRWVGIISAFLFAISFEQTQYAIFFGHPASGVVAVLIFYLGLSTLIFKKNPWGLVISLTGLGLALQFEDVNGLFILNLVVFLLAFLKSFKVNLKFLFFGVGIFLLTLSSFIIAELKYNFRTTNAVISLITSFNKSSSGNIEHASFVINRLIGDNFLGHFNLALLAIIVLLSGLAYLILSKNFKEQGLFLSIWFFLGLIPIFLTGSFSYYYTPGLIVSLLIVAAFLVYKLFSRSVILGCILLAVITVGNINLITSQNYKGVSTDILIQPKFLTIYQKQTLDYMYQKAEEQPFAVSAITVPFNVKTTWDYLFNWYGLQKYHYLPVWGHEAASGFYGSLPVETDRAKLPQRRFLIIEPTVGIENHLIENFLKEESYFSKVIEEKKFGTITVQYREKI